MSEVKAKGISIKGVKITRVDPSKIPPPPDILATSLTATTPQPFEGKAPGMFARGLPKPSLPKQPPAPAPLALPKPVAVPALPPVLPKPVLTGRPIKLKPTVPLTFENEENENENENENEEDEDDESILPPIKKPLLKIAHESVSPELSAYQEAVDADEAVSTYAESEPEPYIPQDNKKFFTFIKSRYSQFELPQILGQKINPTACDSMTLQTYKYQAFIREFMRDASPYRGILVYHGLGSGKTCTSIAAAESLYGQSGKKIIVMTPATLRQNYLRELTFCGFRHNNLENFWVKIPLKPAVNQVFARAQVSIPEKLINSILRRPDQQRVFWMPDLSKTESNFKTLEAWEQTAIREQINSVLQEKIEFISYNGITTAKLKEMIEEQTHFDDAVIIIDEVHNLTRLMYTKIDKYLRPGTVTKKGKTVGETYYEPVTSEKWVPDPKKKGNYSRAILFYRLLCQAKNSKIIALSGTPIVNNPTEVGILGNILHGYFHTVQDVILSIEKAVLDKADTILKNHPRVAFYELKKAEAKTIVFFSVMDEKYEKLVSDKGIEGVIAVEDEFEPPTLEDIYTEVKDKFKALEIPLVGKPEYNFLPLFPPTRNMFMEYFINNQDLRIKNKLTFIKRLSGLVSYYKGSKKELMPEVIRDELVKVNMSALQMPSYAAARKKEHKEEEKMGDGKVKFADIVTGLENEEELASYRFLSRSICNFVFPSDIERPFPRKKSDIKKIIETKDGDYGDGGLDIGENPEAIAQAEAEKKAVDSPDVSDDDIGKFEDEEEEGKPKPTARIIPYQEQLKNALAKLNSRKYDLFKMDKDVPIDQQLKTYSPKFQAILENVFKSDGSNLVYSSFKTVEGLGTFAMAMEANDFDAIRIMGPERDLEFTPETVKSFMENPDNYRYIMYSGDATAVERSTLLNIFNMQLDNLPPKIKKVILESELAEKKNKEGEICRVFMITGAGAEGLSLKNVRSVHIMEPHWNKVRTEQVKGRAVRICSHKDLEYSEDPSKNQRTVEIFTYLTVIDPELIKAKGIDQTIILKDNSVTSDEYLYGVSERKDKLGQDFLSAMKEGAVDCQLNYFENEKVACYNVESQSEFLYDPRITEDIIANNQFREVKAQAVAVAPAKEVRQMKAGDKFFYVTKEGAKEIMYLSEVNARGSKNPYAELIREEGKPPRMKKF